ncbi:hypothetical protein NVS55_28480 [Myxococcus stipitatus]|uniref:hypothetical protein n=1 Tax=Myxococcus stipitatus TaxID=83455 RepID=UPI0031451269
MRISRVPRSALLLGLLLGGGARAAEVPTFLVDAMPASSGSAFVVKDWRAGRQGRFLLLTALHVLHRKSSAAISSVDCSDAANPLKTLRWTITSGTPVLVWPRYDLAALEIPPGDAVALQQESAGEVDFNGWPKGRTLAVYVHGFSEGSVCANSPGFLMGKPVAEKLAQYLVSFYGVAGQGKTPEQLTQLARGSIASHVPLIQYFSPAAPGASGAAVTLPERAMKVVGVHNAGLAGSSVSWAVAFEGQRLALAQPEAIAHLGFGDWPRFDKPQLSQALSLDVFAEDKQAMVLRSMNDRSFELAWQAEVNEGWSSTSQAVRASVTQELGWLSPVKRTVGFGLRFSLGYRWSKARETLSGPDEGEFWEKDLWAKGFYFEPELEMRLFQLSRYRPALGFSARLWSANYSLWESSAQQWEPSLAGSLRVYLSPKDSLPVSFLLELRLARGWEVRPRHRYTGVGANLDTRADALSWQLGTAVGAAY